MMTAPEPSVRFELDNGVSLAADTYPLRCGSSVKRATVMYGFSGSAKKLE